MGKAAKAEPGSIALLGAGVAGTALAAQLRRKGCRAPIRLFEAGRGPGGRAATRRTRRDPAWRLDHGAPLLSLSGAEPPALLEPLLAGGWLEAWPSDATLLHLDGDGRLRPSGPAEPFHRGALYRGRAGMDHLAAGLLALAEAEAPLEAHFGVQVAGLECRPEGWQLFDAEGRWLAQAEWLVLSGSLLAHPRGPALLGWPEIPLRRAAAPLADPELEAALAAIAALDLEARSNLLLMIPAAEAAPWLALPFRDLVFSLAAQHRWGLRRLSLQPLADGRCGVVAHSSAVFAAQHLGVSGGTPAAAAVIDKLSEALMGVLAVISGSAAQPWPQPPLPERQLMRWGAALPQPPGLDPKAMLCPASRVAFCGDAVAGEGFGRIEGAWRSGEALAGVLAGLLSEDPSTPVLPS